MQPEFDKNRSRTNVAHNADRAVAIRAVVTVRERKTCCFAASTALKHDQCNYDDAMNLCGNIFSDGATPFGSSVRQLNTQDTRSTHGSLIRCCKKPGNLFQFITDQVQLAYSLHTIVAGVQLNTYSTENFSHYYEKIYLFLKKAIEMHA